MLKSLQIILTFYIKRHTHSIKEKNLKVKTFFKNTKEYFITSIIILAIFCVFYALFDAFPFGENTIAHYDMAAQIIPFSEVIFDFLNGKSPLFYSTSFLTGINTFGPLIYFILSPFNLALLLGGEGNLFFTLNIVFVLKLIVICSVSIWFLKKYFPNLSLLKILILSLSYTFCGYMLMMYTYMSFLDYLIFAPILVHFFNKIQESNNFLPLSYILFFMIMSCFSLGSFSLLYLFVIFGAYIFIVVDKEKRVELITKTLIALLIAIAFALPVLIPSFISYLGSGRNSDSSILNYDPYYSMSTKILTAIAEVFLCVFAIMFIIKCDKKNKMNKFIISLEILTLSTIIFDEILANFNGGSIYGYFSRFGFVGAFVTLIAAAKYLSVTDFNTPSNKVFTTLNYLMTVVFGLISLICLYYLYDALSAILSYQYASFSYLFAWIIFIIVLFLPFIISLILKKFIGKHFIIITFILSLILISSNTVIFFEGGVLSSTPYSTLESLCSENVIDDRVKFYSTEYYSLNQTVYDVSSIGGFSSLLDKENLNSLSKLGFSVGTNICQSFAGTALSDIVVNNKYIVYPYEINRDYLKFIDSENGFYLYENTLCQDYALLINNEITEEQDLVLIQQQIFESLGGEGSILNKVDVELSFENCEIKDDEIVLQNTRSPGTITCNLTLNQGEVLYLYFNPIENANIQVDNCDVSNRCFVELFTKDPSSTTIITRDTVSLSCLEFYTLDTKLLQNLPTLSSKTTEDYNKILSTITLTEDSSVMLSFQNLDGYSVYVNGEKQEFTNEFLSFITLDLKAGENEIEIVFNNPLFKYIILGFVIGAVLIAIALIVYKYKEKINKKFILIAFSIVFGVFVAYFIAYPTCVNLLKLVNII